MIQPKISVLTPIYNTNPAHLRECIESVLNQSFSDFEFLILNDSPENQEIKQVVLSYQDKRIKYFENEHNLGISESRNKLITLAKGEYLAVFDHDDISTPDRFELEARYLNTHPEIGCVSCWAEYFGVENKILQHPETNLKIKMNLLYNCVVLHSGCMIRKSVLEENNIWYEQAFSPAEDWRLFTRLMDYTSFYNIPKVLLKYRTHITQTSKISENKINNAWPEIAMDVQARNLRLWLEAEKVIIRRTNWLYLFGFLPIVKTIHLHKNTWYFLFGIVPLLKIRRYSDRKDDFFKSVKGKRK